MADKVDENRVRRIAERRGMRLVKRRRRDTQAIDYERYALVYNVDNRFEIGADGKWTLEQIEEHLLGPNGPDILAVCGICGAELYIRIADYVTDDPVMRQAIAEGGQPLVFCDRCSDFQDQTITAKLHYSVSAFRTAVARSASDRGKFLELYREALKGESGER